jgi:hypothetical protein
MPAPTISSLGAYPSGRHIGDQFACPGHGIQPIACLMIGLFFGKRWAYGE